MRVGRRPATLTGRVANCAIWIPNGRTGWKCGNYARVCEPPKCKDAPDPNIKQVKVCSVTQKVFSAFLAKMVTRCKRYETACEGAPCMAFTMPYPTEEAEPKPDPTEVKSIAEWMAERANEEASAQIPYLAREILERGGIRAMRKGYAKEEYSTIPLFLKRKTGMPMDEMASEMGYDYENDLIIAIQKAYPARTKREWKKPPKKARWTEYQEDAYDYIEAKMEEGEWPS